MDNNNGNKRTARSLALYLGIPIVILVACVLLFGNGSKKSSNYIYSDIKDLYAQQKVSEYTLNTGTGDLVLKLNDSAGTVVNFRIPNLSLFYNSVGEYIDKYNEEHPGAHMKEDVTAPEQTSWIVSLLPTIVLFLVIGVLWFFMWRRLSASMGDASRQMNFGKAKIKNTNDEKRKTTFADVAGAEEEKEELREIVEFLKDPKKYNELGARIPKGVLLVGPPGTGKTLLARAVAGEAGVPFFSISGSDFVEMFVGVGASRVRDLFDKAKKNSPCIVFIDEIDAVGRQRGAGLGGGHDEREQTLNQLLVEMDGFGANEGVIMIAATNRPDILDPALMRPGRFDRNVTVGYPDIKGREAILRVHSRNKPIAPDVDLRTIAGSTAGFTGADLENLLNEAALLAARKNLRAITMEEIEEATIKVVVGTEKKSHVMTEREKTLTAYHEAGHAVVTYYCEHQDPVHQISIVPRGMAGGYTMQVPTEDRSYQSKKEMLEELIVLLGGRVSEALVLDDISTGASNDIERATKLVRSMVTRYGMSDSLGPIKYGISDDQPFLGRDMGHVRDYSEVTAAEIDTEIREMMNHAYHQAETLLKEHISQLHEVAKFLYLNEKMSGEEFASVMGGKKTEAIEETAADSEPTRETEISTASDNDNSDKNVEKTRAQNESENRTETNEEIE